MTKVEYLKFHSDFCDQMKAITKTKNADYTGLSNDPFFNFRSCEKLQVASSMQGFMVRMLDKFARLNSFAQKGFLEVKEESVFDTLLDISNYAILMSGFIKSETAKMKEEKDKMVWGQNTDGSLGKVEDAGVETVVTSN